MVYEIGDIFIGNFPLTQSFGARADVYSARYGLKGHNGTDFGCPSLTPVLAANDGIVTEQGFDNGGYGNYIKITHPGGYLTIYGHLNDIQTKEGDTLVQGQLIGHSNNTGFSDAPHLHFGVAPCDKNGIKTQSGNGYSGYIDPLGSLCHWTIKNLTRPISPQVVVSSPTIPVPSSDFTRAVTQGTQFKVIAQYAVQNNINQYLQSQHIGVLDLDTTPDDTQAGEKINRWIQHLLSPDIPPPLSTQVSNLPISQQTSLLQKIISALNPFTHA